MEGLARPGRNEPRVRDESHLNDMRAAIRGDFERLARRRGTQELMQEPVEAAPESEPEAPAEPEPERAPEPVAEARDELTEEAPEAEAPAVDDEEEPASRGFFARLLGF
jgi:hypothetical protein